MVARATPRTHAAELAERARAAVAEQPFTLDDGRLLSKTCSIGFCCFPLSTQYPGAPAWVAAINVADALRYAVKAAGRNGWMGALDAHGESPEAILDWSRRPVADWARSGNLEVVRSPVSRTPGHGP